jgi:tetratricopeptide (TPR) repeat protein
VAEYWVRRENWPMAAETGKEGLKCTYATEEVHSNLAVALATAQMKMGEIGDALSTIEEICEAYPDSSHQQFRKVKLLVLLGRKEEALTLAGEVRTSAMHQTGCAPASSSLWSLLGDCSSLLGDIAGAEEAYTNALKYDFMDSVAVRGLGIVAEKKGDLLRALEMYQRFVVLDPLNLATPAIRNRIKELIEKVGPLPEPEPPPPPPTLQVVAPPPPAAAAPATMHTEDERQEAATGAPEGWLGGDDSMDWYE